MVLVTVYELIRRLSEYPADWTVELTNDPDADEVQSMAVFGVMPKPSTEVPAPNTAVIW